MAPRAGREAVVAVTDPVARLQTAASAARLNAAPGRRVRRVLFLLLLGCGAAPAATLPEDRADLMYHSYDGGGLNVDGPSILVRKAYKDKISVWGNYYVDYISSASIDVVSTASEYKEKRKEKSVGIDYLTGKTTMGLSFTASDESDYNADTARFGISQDFFGDLTTLALSYARGRDTVQRNGDDTFEEHTDRQHYRVDLTQVITPELIISLNYEGITDEGFLNNPYRQVRFRDPFAARGFSYEPEIYPETKTSSAVALRAAYHLPYRAAVHAEARYYSDSWEVDAYNVEVSYVHPLPRDLTVELKYRYYDQSAAEFYSDLFDRSAQQNFLARDKELSTFNTMTVGAGLSYDFKPPWVTFLERGQLSVFADWIRFDYDDFRDVRVTDASPGEEPLYQFDSLVLRIFVSFWY